MLIDTHCHIHDQEFFSKEDALIALADAKNNNINQLICIGTSLEDSKRAIQFSSHNQGCYATIGIHPHEALRLGVDEVENHLEQLEKIADKDTVVGIGECGFDFFYNSEADSLESQERLLRGQIDIAIKHNLPLSFHVRDAFEQFWRVFDEYNGVEGVLHSFTDNEVNLTKALQRGLYVGINGISTFTKHTWQRNLFRNLPLDHIILETDAPYLTPVPRRGTINTPENVIYITRFLADLRGEEPDLIAKVTTANAKKLFKI
jgi:TatD DNase family protein